jgi:clan AA aspartic protease (TIGR02281 family)
MHRHQLIKALLAMSIDWKSGNKRLCLFLLAAFSLCLAAPACLAGDVAAAANKDFDDGTAQIQAKNFQVAIKDFQRAYQHNVNPEMCSYYIGVCYVGLGDLPHGKQYFEFVNAHFPGTTAASLAATAMKQIASIPANMVIAVSTQAPGSAPPAPSASAGIITEGWQPYRSNGSGSIIVSATIDGQPAMMMFDTGAEVSMITTSQLERMGIKLGKIHASNARIHGTGGESEVSVADVVISAGGLTRRTILFVQDDRVLSGNQGASAVFGYPLLGQTFFGDFAYEIDGRNQMISIHAPSTAKSKGYDPNEVPFTYGGKCVVVKPIIHGRECEMILDTGAAYVAFTDGQFSGFGFSRPTSARQGYSIGVGGKRNSYQFNLDSVKLGPLEKQTVRAGLDLNGTMPKPLLGMSFFEHEHFIVEPKLHVIRFFP